MQPTIFDLGMNNGDDTAYYLAKSFRVVAIEANPYLCKSAGLRFHEEIRSGALTILNAAVTDKCQECVFYINLDNDHWSSLDIQWASRNESRVSPHAINGVTLSELVRNHGVPHFLKIDIEGGDRSVLEQMTASGIFPAFLSIEDCRFGYEYLELLYKIGYRRFKLSDQTIVPQQQDPAIDHPFMPGSSGMFGNELAGEWRTFDSFLDHYSKIVRSRETLIKIAAPHVWWDIHCGE